MRKQGKGTEDHSQVIKSLHEVVIMPIYGSLAFLKRGMLGLPMSLIKEDGEKLVKFRKRVDKAETRLINAIEKINGVSNGYWLKEKFKRKRINHPKMYYS